MRVSIIGLTWHHLEDLNAFDKFFAMDLVPHYLHYTSLLPHGGSIAFQQGFWANGVDFVNSFKKLLAGNL